MVKPMDVITIWILHYSIARGELNEILAHLINAHVLQYCVLVYMSTCIRIYPKENLCQKN
jgi:hypothetical protein